MSNVDHMVPDARLVAFLDGALPEDQARALRAEIAEDPALQARLSALDVDLSGLRPDMDALVPDAPLPAVLARGSAVQLAAAAVVALALLLGGVLIGVRATDRPGDWRDFAAAYHLLYRTETLASGEIAGDGGVARVSDLLGRDLSSLAQIDGLDFRRAQILGWEDQPLVQFAYLDAQGRPVAVCLMATGDANTATGFEQAERHRLSTVTFADDGLQVLVIGAEGMGGIEALAEGIAAQF